MSITPLSTVQNTRASAEEMPGQSVRFRPMGKKRLILTRFLRNRLAVFGVFLLALLSAFALFGHHLTPWQYTEQDFLNLGTGPSAEHWLAPTRPGWTWSPCSPRAPGPR